MLKFTSTDIDNLLYSALRSNKHFKVRQKSYLKRGLQLVYLYITVPSKKYPLRKKTILNYLNKTYIDFTGVDLSEEFKFDLEESQLKPLYIVELLLIISFLLNVKFLQKFLFRIASNVTFRTIKTRTIESLICGHPDLLISFLGYCLKMYNKEVITVQHGIYNISSYEVLWWEKEVATKVIVYGEDFKNLYVSQRVKEENVIIGNPYFGSVITSSDTGCADLQLKNKKVIFLGQQLYKISESVFSGYNNFLHNFILYFEQFGVEIVYKPHPREDINKSLSSSNIEKLTIYNKRGKPRDLYQDFDFYYSVNSSILIELYLQKKICFQVEIPIDDFSYDDFKDYTGIPLVNIHTLDEHLNYDYKFYYDRSYLNIQKEHNKYMVKLISQILKETQSERQMSHSV